MRRHHADSRLHSKSASSVGSCKRKPPKSRVMRYNAACNRYFAAVDRISPGSTTYQCMYDALSAVSCSDVHLRNEQTNYCAVSS